MFFISILCAIKVLPYEEKLEDSKEAHVIVFTDPFINTSLQVLETVERALSDVNINVWQMDCDVFASRCYAYGMMAAPDVVFYSHGRPIHFNRDVNELAIRNFVKIWLLRDAGKYKELMKMFNAQSYAVISTSDLKQCYSYQTYRASVLIDCVKAENEQEGNTVVVNWENGTIQKFLLPESIEKIDSLLLPRLRQEITELVDVKQLIGARAAPGALIFTSNAYEKEIMKLKHKLNIKQHIFVVAQENIQKAVPIRFKMHNIDVIYCYEVSDKENGYASFEIKEDAFQNSLEEALERISEIDRNVQKMQNMNFVDNSLDYLEKKLFMYVMSKIIYRCIDTPWRFIKKTFANLFGRKQGCGGGCGGCSGKCGQKCGENCGCGKKGEEEVRQKEQQIQQQQQQQNQCQCPKCQLQRIRQSGCRCEKCQHIEAHLIQIIQTAEAQQREMNANPAIQGAQMDEVIANDIENITEQLEEGEEFEEAIETSSGSNYAQYCVDNKKED